MNTGSDEALPYRELARRQARLQRQVGVDELSRLAATLAEPRATLLDVGLAFDRDTQGRAVVAGTVSGSLHLVCAGCAEALAHDLALEFRCVIVESDAAAAELDIEDEVVVAGGPEISVAELVEDEVLLSLPERLCRTTPCERAPVLEYPAADSETAENVADDADNPFSVLAGLDVGTNGSRD